MCVRTIFFKVLGNNLQESESVTKAKLQASHIAFHQQNNNVILFGGFIGDSSIL